MSRPDLIGTVLAGRYKIIGLIGEGGMGSVYLGEQIAMGRKTAIKVLHTDAEDAAAIARFRQGSRNAARIDHRNVCRIFEYGDPPGGLHFLAMEFIEGESIHDLMTRKGPIQLGRATRIIEQTVEALHAAHSLGIVHRDLKPANIMLTRGLGGEEIVKVVDFDIAKTPSDTGDEEITQLDWMVGTPLYMSPEQFQAQALDKRSDIYSLAIVLFRMISGSFPFSETTSPWAIMAERMTSPPRPLSQAAPDMVFPPKLQEALDRALQLEPDERWPSVLEFGEALHEAVSDWVDEEEPLEEESPGTELLERPWGSVSTLEEPTPAASDSELEGPHPAGAAAAADVVDLRIPATEVGPKPPLPRTKKHPPKARRSSARRLRRAIIAMTVTLALGASAWGVYTTLAGPPETPPPAAGGPSGEDPETAEQRLSEFGQQFESAEPPSMVTRAEQNGTATPDGPDSPPGGAETPPPGGLSGEDPETAEQRLRCEDAVPAAEQAIAQEPDNVVGPLVVGRCLEADERYDEALEVYAAFQTDYPGASGSTAIQGQQRLALQAQAVQFARAAIAGSLAFAASADAVAVLPLLLEGDSIYASLSRGLANLIVSDLDLLQRFQFVERLQINAILNELALGQTSAADPQTLARAGQIIRAEQTIQGTASVAVEGQSRLTAAVVNLAGVAEAVEVPPGPLEDLLDMDLNLCGDVRAAHARDRGSRPVGPRTGEDGDRCPDHRPVAADGERRVAARRATYFDLAVEGDNQLPRFTASVDQARLIHGGQDGSRACGRQGSRSLHLS